MKRTQRRRTRGSPTFVAVAWYSHDTWITLKGISADPETYHNKYADWVRSTTDAMEQLSARGAIAIPIAVTAAELVEWCGDRNRALDGTARSEFAVWKAERQAAEERDRLNRSGSGG